MANPEQRLARVMKSMEKRIAVLEAGDFGGGFDGDSVVFPILSADERMVLTDRNNLNVNQLKSLTMKTTGFSSVDDSSARLFGELDRLTASNADVDFQYGEQSGSVTDNNTADQQFSSPTNYDFDVTGLTPGTTYEFRARGVASDGDTDTGGTQTFTTDSASGTTVIDDFEDGDITTKSGDWDGWTGATGSLSAQTGTVLAGTTSGELAAGSGNDNRIETTRTAGALKINEVSTLIEIDNQPSDDNDGQRLVTDNTSNQSLSSVLFRQNGDIDQGVFTTTIGSWSTGTTYKVRLYNHDYSAETYDIEVTRQSDSTVVASASGVGFANSSNKMLNVRAINDMDSGSGGASLYLDDVTAII